jgi:putative hemolysin
MEIIVFFELFVLLGVCSGTILGSGFLSFSEAAMMSLNKHKFNVYQLKHPDKIVVKSLSRALKNKNKFITTIILLNTIVNIGGSMIIGVISAKLLGGYMAFDFSYLFFKGTKVEFLFDLALTLTALFSILFTIVLYLFAEMIPKLKASQNPLPFALFVAIPLCIFEFFMKPVVWVSIKIGSLFVKDGQEPTVCLDEVKTVIKEANNFGLIKDRELDIINNTFKLSEKIVSDLMLCKTKIEFIDMDESILEHREHIINLEHKRVIVIDNKSDTPVGVVVVKDILQGILRDENKVVGDYMHELLIVNENDSLSHVLADFNETIDHLALVKCNDDSFLGVLAVEDILDSISLGFPN